MGNEGGKEGKEKTLMEYQSPSGAYECSVEESTGKPRPDVMERAEPGVRQDELKFQLSHQGPCKLTKGS